MTTAQTIKEIRISKNMSQYALADKTDGLLNQSQISKIEKGARKITEKDLFTISKALYEGLTTLITQIIPRKA